VVDRNLVGAKLADLAVYIERVRKHAKATSAALSDDRDARDLVAFNLMLAVQVCADIAAHIIADSGWSPARTLSESFERLQQQAVLSPLTANALGKAVGLRNVVAHGYAGIDVVLVHQAATEGVSDLEAFAREIAGWVTAQP
jgi:uncharacterized protein YutE (UPF0331/DUF86 family)